MDGAVLSSESEPVAVHVIVVPVSGLRGVSEMLSTVGGVLDTVTVALLSVVAEKPSVAVAVQLTLSNGDTVDGVSVMEAVVPSAVPAVSLVHAYVTVTDPPSGSVAAAAHVSDVLVSIPLFGVMLATVVNSGGEFTMVTVLAMESVPESLSVAVAVQRILSVGETSDGLNVSEDPVPMFVSVVTLYHA